MLMERDKLVEKHAKAEGLGEVKVGWIKVAGPSVMNDGIISGALQFISVGAPSLITLWDKTQDNVQVKGMSALTTYPLYLNVRNPNVKSIRDFSDKDKIAVPSVKISTQAIMLADGGGERVRRPELRPLRPMDRRPVASRCAARAAPTIRLASTPTSPPRRSTSRR